MSRYLVFAIVFFYCERCNSQTFPTKRIKGTYNALFAETLWSYKFNPNQTYVYQTSIHFGYSKTKGRYKINGDTIILKAFPAHKQKDPNFFLKSDTLLIQSDTCLIPINSGYEHLLIKNKHQTLYTSKKRDLALPGRPIVREY